MYLKSVLLRLSLVALALVPSGCGLLGGNPTQGIGIASKNCLGDSTAYPVGKCLPGSELMLTPNVPVWGNETSDYYLNGADQTNGTIGFYGNNGDPPASTGWNALLVVNNAEAPAFWDLNYLEPWNCGYNADPDNGPVYEGYPYWNGVYWWEYKAYGLVQNYYPNKVAAILDCYTYGSLPIASTRFAILGSFPNTLTLGSQAPLMTQYGTPLLYVYDKTGNVVATQTATSVSSDGSQATFPFPSTLQQSGYSLAMVNQTGGGVGFAPAGDNLLSIASSQTISGNPFGVAVGAQTTETINCVFVPEGTPTHVVITTQCSQSSSNPNPIPVVTLYSANQALIGSIHVNVGANPTAVATYTANAIINTVNNSNGYTTTILFGSLRAIVADSGSNTVTILDTVAGAPVATVTVGRTPVALAVSSDGTAGYVANYADSTVTKVNLSTNTPATTVSVGGKPTSVTLTFGGTLWVGGAGFLTEINASTMAVVGTESVPSRNIVALSYSDQLGQLIVQSTGSTGAVYQDEMNPASFTAGGTYAAIASHTVSTLGSYTVGSAHVRAFTSTLSKSGSLPINLPGAPPLVVQDNWAVVTATPTGFTITDASGHEVLVSEKTPSPIAAIAVDPNLHIVYLTMPDSNTLLTVPLPGIN
jgi:YVTN family beta-propeller protein